MYSYEPVNGCPLKRKGDPCGLKGKDEEGTYWFVWVDTLADGAVTNLLDQKSMVVDYKSQRREIDGSQKDLAASMIEEIREGNGSCAVCGTRVKCVKTDTHPDEAQEINSAINNFFTKKTEDDDEPTSISDALGL